MKMEFEAYELLPIEELLVIIVCLSCQVALRVIGDAEVVDHLLGSRSVFVEEKYKCFRCGGCADVLKIHEVEPQALKELSEVIDLTPEEAFAALNGLGTPSERTCCKEVLDPIFDKAGIKVKGHQPHGSMRFYVDYLEMPDGTRLHFASSPGGAVIYRVVPPYSYTSKVLSENNAGT